MKRLILALGAFLVAASAAFATPLTERLGIAEAGVILASQHSAPCYNNQTRGVYLVHAQGWIAGAYENSESRTTLCGRLKKAEPRFTVYTGYELRTPEVALGGVNWSAFAKLALGTGYVNCDPLCLGGAVGLRGEVQGWVVRLEHIPRVKRYSDSAVTVLSVGWEF